MSNVIKDLLYTCIAIKYLLIRKTLHREKRTDTNKLSTVNALS